MLERDYIMRLLQEFMKALSRFLEKKEKDEDDAELRDIYRQYVGDYAVWRNLSVEEALQHAHDEWDDEHRMTRLKMLAELLLAEAKTKDNPLSDMLLGKSYRLMDYIDQHDDTYSISRKHKMNMIKTLLGIGDKG